MQPTSLSTPDYSSSTISSTKTSASESSTTGPSVPSTTFETSRPTYTNLVQNPGFENNGGSLSAWDTATSTNSTVGSSFAGLTQPGSNSANAARIYAAVLRGDSNQEKFALIRQALPVVEYVMYNISYDMAISAVPPPGVPFACIFKSKIGGRYLDAFRPTATHGYLPFSTVIPFYADNPLNRPYTIELSVTCTNDGPFEVELDNLSVVQVE
ncbi:hypothetical protein JX266_002378 [Neoarthrinium moseri]|nr:hypothetical protein JX266_002378 [Neoarthrinium moseri]